MASSYSSNLKLELIGTGDQSGTWGNTTNTNLGVLLEQAIVGYTTQAITDGADTVLTIANGTSSVARNYVLQLTGALTANRNLIVPAIQKSYVIFNTTTGGFSVTVKVSGQTGVTIANGKKAIVYNNGTDIIEVVNAAVTETGTQTLTNKTLSTGTAITAGTINNASVGATTPSTGAFTTLSASSTVSGTGFSTYLASPPAIGGTTPAAITGTTVTANTGFTGQIGGVTPNAGAFTTLSASSTVSGTGFSNYLASPPAIGGTTANTIRGTTITATTAFSGPLNGTVGATTPSTGAFTTLSASSTVSGTGFSDYLASPPAIGSTTANTGRFSTLNTLGNFLANGSAGTSGQYLQSAGAGAAPVWSTVAGPSGSLIRAPQLLTTGTSYTTPSNCTKIYVELTGGGAGASGTSGGTTSFTVGATTVSCTGATGSTTGGTGGTATNADFSNPGQSGTGYLVLSTPTNAASLTGGPGAGTLLGTGGGGSGDRGGYGAGGGGYASYSGNFNNGFGVSTNIAGGASSAYAAKYFTVTGSTAYTYAIGAGGTGTAGTNGPGGQGVIRIWEYT